MLLTMIFSSSCQKNFNSISISNWQPKVAAPLFKTEVNFSDIIGNNSGISTEPDSSMVYVYHQDSIFSLSADSLLQIDKQVVHNYSFSLGILSMDNFSIADDMSLNNLLPNMDTNVADTLKKYDGKNHVFPPFRINQTYTLNLPSVNTYSKLTFSEGSLDLITQNNLPVNIDSLAYNLIDLSTGQVIKSVMILNLAAGTSQSTSINLQGKTLSNSFEATLIFSSQGSYPNKVNIDLAKGLSFNFQASNLKVISGIAKIPQQQFFSEEKITDLIFNNGEELYGLLFQAGNIHFNLISGIATQVNVHVILPSALLNNSIPAKDLITASSANLQEDWNLTDMSFDLTTKTAQGFNSFPMLISGNIPQTNQLVSFDSSDQLMLSFNINSPKLASANGYLGKRNFNIRPDSLLMDLSFLKKLNGELILNDPVMRLNYKNGFGIPINMNMDFVASNIEKGTTQDLSLNPISLLYPSTEGQSVEGTVTVDKNNSSIVDFISLLPDRINYSGSLHTNSDGKRTNFVSRSSDFSADAEVRIPLILQAKQLTFSDTITDLHISTKDLPIDSGTILAVVTNGFPFELKMQVIFPDSITGQTLTSLDFGTIQSAKVDSTGKVNQTTQSEININITKDFLDKVAGANTGIVHLETSTFSNGSVPVQIYSGDNVKVSVGFSTTLKP